MANLTNSAVVLVMLLGNRATASAQADFDEVVADQVAAATVLIVTSVVELQNGIPMQEYWQIPLGSGVLVSADGHIVTNSHVVDLTALRNDVETEENTQGIDLEIIPDFLIYVVDGTDDDPDPRYRAALVSDQPGFDLAVLDIAADEDGRELRRPVGDDRIPIDFAPSNSVETRDPVHIFGYPVFGREAFSDFRATTIDVVDGRIRSFEQGVSAGNPRLIYIDATVSSGSSGGAVVDDGGRLIGVIAAARSAAAGGSVAVAIPIGMARAVLESAGVQGMPPPASPRPIDTPAIVPPSPTVGPEVTAPTIETPTMPPAVSTADVELFASLLAAQPEAAPLAGPFSGQLKEVETTIALTWAGVTVTDFHAHVIFDVPNMASTNGWDVGFIFGNSSVGPMRLVVNSFGSWFYSVGAASASLSGPVPTLNTAPGGSNTLDVFVANRRALFGVNNELVAVIDLPADVGPGDVGAGVAWIVGDAINERITRFSEFVIYPLSPDALTPK